MVITPLDGSYPYLCQLTSANKNVLKLQFVWLKCETRFHLRPVKSKACHFQGLVLPLRHGVPHRHDSYAHLSPGPCSLPRRWQRPSLHEKIHSMDGLFAPGTKLPPQCSQPCLRYEVCISNMFVGQVTISVRIITYHHHFKWLHTPFFSLGKSSFLKCRASPKTLNGPWSSLLLNGWAKKTILTQFYGDITH